MFLYGMRPYVIVVSCVCVRGVPVLVKSGHRDQISPGQELQAHTHTHTHTHTQLTTMTYGLTPYKNITNVHPQN